MNDLYLVAPISCHTPGPWEVVRGEYGKPVSIHAVGRIERAILKFGAFLRPSWADTDADACLMAAAPDLAAALRAAADYLDCIPESAAGGDDDAVRLVRACRAALAKAIPPTKEDPLLDKRSFAERRAFTEATNAQMHAEADVKPAR